MFLQDIRFGLRMLRTRSGVHRRRGGDARARHWREHRHLHALQRQLGDVLVLILVGFLVGIPSAVGASRLVASQIVGFRSAAPLSFAIAILLLGTVAVVTGLIPVRRATRLDPLVALRDE